MFVLALPLKITQDCFINFPEMTIFNIMIGLIYYALTGLIKTSLNMLAVRLFEIDLNYSVLGLKMLYEAWKMKPNEGEETQREVEEELARRGSTPSLNSTATGIGTGIDKIQGLLEPKTILKISR